MRRKYEVWIGGKRLTIGERPDVTDSSQQPLTIHAVDSSEVESAVQQLGKDDVRSVHLDTDAPEHVWKMFSMKYVHVDAAGGCVTDEQGRLLAILRLGVWDLPKGKVDKGEGIEEAAVREVKEECGLDRVEPVRHLCDTWHTYERKGEQHLKRTQWFLMRANSKERLVAQSEEDITEVRWFGMDDLKMMRANTYPSLQDVISAWEAAPDRV